MTPQGLEIFDHQTAESLGERLMARLLEQGRAALAEILTLEEADEPVLRELEAVEVSFVDDETIARVHVDFMDIPGATDVITFHHGEILISTETTRRQASEFGQSFECELFRYLIHGLLHLHGHTDAQEDKRAAMHEVQERLVEAYWS